MICVSERTALTHTHTCRYNNSACFAALCQIHCLLLLIHTISSFFVKIITLCTFLLFLQSKVCVPQISPNAILLMHTYNCNDTCEIFRKCAQSL